MGGFCLKAVRVERSLGSEYKRAKRGRIQAIENSVKVELRENAGKEMEVNLLPLQVT